MQNGKKIALGVNLFGKSVRTDLCIESLLAIKRKFPDIIDLYNLQFKDVTKPGRMHNEFKLLTALETSNQTYVPESQRTIPIMKELFDILSDLNYSHFIFTNDDIIVSDRFISFILETDYETYPASRLAIEPISTLTEAISGDHYQVAGFDTFCIKTEWWKKHRHHFPAYILGHPCWDVHYATLCMRYSKSTLCNKWPPPTFHIKHGDGQQYSGPDVDYNNSLYWKPAVFDVDMWHHYLFNVLLLRKGGSGYWTPFDNELELEKLCFNDEWFKKNYWSYEQYKLDAMKAYANFTSSTHPQSF